MTALVKAFKYYRRFMIIFGIILGIALFLATFIYGGQDIMDSLGMSLIGFALPIEVHLIDHETK